MESQQTSCLDGLTLAAFARGSLAAADRNVAEAHLAQCDACTRILAEVARAASDDARSGEMDSLVAETQRAALNSDSESHPGAMSLGGGRFELLRFIGRGGMGIVFEALDRGRNEHVALKQLRHVDPSSIYLLKQEFRALADVHHPNLVRLHELFCEDDVWFFTMELVDGEPFDAWIRPNGVPDEQRIGSALSQLLAGVEAIHAAGKLHRDLKPSNVLVARDGRVVVLDFGLVSTRERGGVGRTWSGPEFVGTPAYMAPEQATGAAATPASDLYSVGVMLFQAITGRLPFESSSVGAMLAAKIRDEPPSPGEFGEGGLLSALCTRLLARDPAQRPSLSEARQLAASRALEPTPTSSAPPEVLEVLFGREEELSALRNAFRRSSLGEPVVLAMFGESGIGKSALCHAFLGELRSSHRALVLSGRCHERESVPFKAFDALIDELSRHLRRLPREQCAALLPRDVASLAHVFPSLARVDGVADAQSSPARVDPRDIRQRAFSALGELLGLVRRSQPVVLHIDDLQWADADSMLLLRHMLIARQQAPLLLIVSQRENAENATDALLAAARGNPELVVTELRLEPLSTDAAEALASSLLPPGSSELDATAVSLQARGRPFFVRELSRFARTRDPETGGELMLQNALGARFASLPARARRLLSLIALAGEPVPVPIALQAAEAEEAALDTLQLSQLTRSSPRAKGRFVECYHDLIRESCATLSKAESSELLGRLAAALERHADSNSELLARCLEASGDRPRAADVAERAGDHAFAVLAFKHAAALYRKASSLRPPQHDRRYELLRKLAGAMACVGDGPESCAAHLEAASLAVDPALALAHRGQAADQLIKAGHYAEGTELLRVLCADLGMTFPTSDTRAWLGLRALQAKLQISGLEPRAAQEQGVEVGLRLWTAGTLVTAVEHRPVCAAYAAFRYLDLALQCGQRGVVMDALCSCTVRFSGQPTSSWAMRLRAQLSRMAHEDGSPWALALADFQEGAAVLWSGDASSARRLFARALPVVQGLPFNPWFMDSVHSYDLLAAHACGDFLHIARTIPALIQEAVQRGRVKLAATLMGAGAMAWLVPDDAAGYLNKLSEIRALWQTDAAELRLPDFSLISGELRCCLYANQTEHASSLLAQHAGAFYHSLLVKGTRPYLGFIALEGSVYAAALSTQQGAAREASLATLARCSRELQQPGWAPSAAMLEASAALHTGQRQRAIACLRRAVTSAEYIEARMQAAAARRRLGQLVGGAEGAALIAQGDAAMNEQQIKNREAMTALLCAGCRPVD